MGAYATLTDAMRLSLANHHGALDDLGAWIAAIAARDELPARAAFQLELVLTEAVTNIMDQARSEPSAGRIDIDCRICGDAIDVVIADDGPAFDPTARPEVILPRDLDDATPGGLGIHLMRRYTRGMEYRRENGRNILSMILPRQPGPTLA